MKLPLHIPAPNRLLPQILMHHTHPETQFHGESHWRRVAWVGAHLAAETPDCDSVVVYLFALLHDARRLNNDRDPEHGRRAGALARKLHPYSFRVSPEQLDTLVYACDRHADGDISDEPTVAVCWDADRLDLWRVGCTPDPRWLSTDAAADPECIRWSATLRVTTPAWDAVFAKYTRLSGWTAPLEESLC